MLKNKFFKSFFTFLVLTAFMACQKEESLSPREDLAGPQQFDININPKDTTIGIWDTTGSGGGGINESFIANIDGEINFFDVYTYTDNGSSVIFSATNSSNQSKINFSILGSLSSNQSLTLDGFPNSASYTDTSGTQYISERGTLLIDSLGSDFIRGSFLFDASNQNNPLDSVVVSSGAFQFEI